MCSAGTTITSMPLKSLTGFPIGSESFFVTLSWLSSPFHSIHSRISPFTRGSSRRLPERRKALLISVVLGSTPYEKYEATVDAARISGDCKITLKFEGMNFWIRSRRNLSRNSFLTVL
jgi:hypothetical protein